jgi:hypothetical protein
MIPEQVTATIYIGDEPVQVEGVFWPAGPGSRDEYGAPIEPDYEEEIEVISATLNGDEIELTEDQQAEAMQAIADTFN